MAASPLLEPLRADPSSAAILCDVDGTLAPIVADPAAAAVPADATRVLAALASRYRLVGFVSGRRASVARQMVGLDEAVYAGNHGLELLGPGDPAPRLAPELGRRAEAAAGFASRLDWGELRRLGLRLEDKGPIQALHWRGAADEASAAHRAEEIGALAEAEGLTTHRGRMVLELRPLAGLDKGSAVRQLLAHAQATAALFGGDDRTDLDAFAALHALTDAGELRHAVCVGVASAEGPAEIERGADLVVRGPDEFLGLLGSL